MTLPPQPNFPHNFHPCHLYHRHHLYASLPPKFRLPIRQLYTCLCLYSSEQQFPTPRNYITTLLTFVKGLKESTGKNFGDEYRNGHVASLTEITAGTWRLSETSCVVRQLSSSSSRTMNNGRPSCVIKLSKHRFSQLVHH